MIRLLRVSAFAALLLGFAVVGHKAEGQEPAKPITKPAEKPAEKLKGETPKKAKAPPGLVVVVNCGVAKETTSDFTKLAFVGAAVPLTDTLKASKGLLWAEFLAAANYMPELVKYFELPEKREGDLILSISVWETWGDAEAFMNDKGHSDAVKKFRSMFEKRDVKDAVAFYTDPLPPQARALELARGRYFVNQLTGKLLVEKLTDLNAKKNPETVFDPREGPPKAEKK